MRALSPAGQQALLALAQRHGISGDAALHMLDAVVRGNGSMAQFNHPEFGGAGQWMRGGMTMVSDLFNNALKARVDNLCSELSDWIAREPGLVSGGSFQQQSQGTPEPAVGWAAPAADPGYPTTGSPAPWPAPVSDGAMFAPAPPDWWGPSLRFPDSQGAQNQMRYAWFSQARRLAVDVGGTVTLYDTLDHQLGGFSQQQGGDGSFSMSSQYGTVALSSLPVVLVNGVPPAPRPVNCAPPAPAPWPAPANEGWASGNAAQNAPMTTSFNANPIANPIGTPIGSDEVLGLIQKLAALNSAGILTDQEFASKKADLLARL